MPRTAVLNLLVPDVPPRVTDMYPYNNYEVGTLTPQLFANAENVDQWPNGVVKYWFAICALEAGRNPSEWGPWKWCLNSPGYSTSPVWQVPADKADKLEWGKDYYWSVWVDDGSGKPTGSPSYLLRTAVAQPAVTSHLASSGADGQELNPQNGNYTTTAVDATVATVGPPLSVVVQPSPNAGVLDGSAGLVRPAGTT